MLLLCWWLSNADQLQNCDVYVGEGLQVLHLHHIQKVGKRHMCRSVR
jgi:hypothetical protein